MNAIRSLFLALAVSAASTAHAFDPLPQRAPEPADNPTTPAKVRLGLALFMDPRLSSDGTISCNSCHGLGKGGVDGQPVSDGVGHQQGVRNAPTVLNAAFMSAQFWDGRAASLEEQAKGPLMNPIEMGNPDADALVARLKGMPIYQKTFARVFGGSNPLTIDHLVQAIAAFERTLITPDSRFDRFLRNDPTARLSIQEQRGMQTFSTIGCLDCHSGVNFSGPAMAPGQGDYEAFPEHKDNMYVAMYHLDEDQGRFQVTGKEEDRHMFRVPTLRNVARTAPYFHNGSVPTLQEAVRVMAKTQLDMDLKDGDIADIVAFLKTLDGSPKPRP